jgi:hypothetical protein
MKSRASLPLIVKDNYKYILFVNTLFLLLGTLYIYFDSTIPFWDLKSHIFKSFEFIESVKRLDFSYAVKLMSSDRAPGTAIFLLPLFAFLQCKLAYIQLFTLLVYGNLFILGNVLLSKELAPSHTIFSYVVVPVLSPILWGLTLHPYFDIGPFFLTPWLIYFAIKADYFQNKYYSAGLGLVLGLEVLFRSYGVYLLFAFCAAYFMYFAEHMISKVRSNSFEFKYFFNVIIGITITVGISLAVSYVTLSGLYKSVFSDIGSTAYLWNHRDRLFYLKALVASSLGGLIFVFSFAGAILLVLKSIHARLLVYFGIASYLTFQFVIQNNDWRYTGPFAAVLIFCAAFFLSHLSDCKALVNRKFVSSTISIIVLAVLGLQLTHHLYNVGIPALKNNTLSNLLYFPKSPLYYYQGNQVGIMRSIYNLSGKQDAKSCSIYIGKDKPEFNYAYYQGIQLLHNRKSSYLVYFSDVPRYHGIPANYFDIDMIVLGESQSEFNNLLMSRSKTLLRNYERMPSLALQTYDYYEPLQLWKKTRPLTIQEQIECQKEVIALDKDNLRNMDQLLWIYKSKIANNLGEVTSELQQITDLIPRAFHLSNVPFASLKDFNQIAEYQNSNTNAAFIDFYKKRGVQGGNNNGSFSLSSKEFDDKYNFRWFFMIAGNDGWNPLLHNDLRSFFKIDNHKWNSLAGDSHIDALNSINIIDKPISIFWLCPRDLGKCKISLSASDITSQNNKYKFTIVTNSNSVIKNETLSINKNHDYLLDLHKNDVVSITFIGHGKYIPNISINSTH